MMRKLLPILLAVLGLGAGAGAGLALRPAPEPALEEAAAEHAPEEPEVPPEYVKLSNQFVVPVVEDGRVVAMVILSLSLEVTAGSTEAVFVKEPKLRDIFLQVLFDHANAGGFNGSFTDGSNMVMLRRALLETATATMGDIVKDVLIVDIVRQDG
jgi:flagellar protein FliL